MRQKLARYIIPTDREILLACNMRNVKRLEYAARLPNVPLYHSMNSPWGPKLYSALYAYLPLSALNKLDLFVHNL